MKSLDRQSRSADAVTIRRLAAEGGFWRVRVETWRSDAGQYAGRIGFEPEGSVSRDPPRWCAANLHATRVEEMVAAAHDVPESRLRRLLHSLA